MTRNVFVEEVKRTVDDFKMFNAGDSLLVGVSGGADSVALVNVLCELKQRLSIKIMVAHFNHQLRAESAEHDLVFVNNLAHDLDVGFVCGELDVCLFAKKNGFSIEQAARYARYDFFVKEARRLGCAKVVLGHNFDDQAETVLMRVLTGTGVGGLSAIRPIMDFQGIQIIRPLINTRRDCIEKFLVDNNILFCTDESNFSRKFLRNKIRHDLLPALEDSFNSKVKDSLWKLAFSARVDNDFIDTFVEQSFLSVFKNKSKDYVVFDLSLFRALHPSIAFRCFKRGLLSLGVAHGIDFFHWSEVWDLIESRFDNSIGIDNSINIIAQYNELVIEKPFKNEPFEYKVNFNSHMQNFYVKEINSKVYARIKDVKDAKFSRDSCLEVFDFDKLSFPLILRSRVNGDRIKPLGMPRAKKVKDLLIDKKIPRYKRRSALIFLSGKDIVWLAPFMASNDFKVTKNTKKILELQVVKQSDE